MDEEATLAAIEVQPSVVYTPEWSEDSTELVLLIDGDLAPLTSYTVRVGTGARTPEGTSLPFPLTASWTTGRAPLELPEAPPLLGVVAPLDSPITVDGLTDEWPAFEIAERNVAIFPEAGGFVWVDALGDDRGPGTYTYPSDSSFSGQDCDIDLFRFGHTEHDLFFSVSLRSINTQASFFTPYIGLAIHTGPGGRTGALGIDLGTGSRGIAEVLVREDFAPNFELIYTGPAGGVLIRPDNSTEAITAAHNAGAATIEWHVSREALGLAEPLENREIAIVVYTGLETFGSMREVVATLSQWNPGGGTNALSDPDVFDLVGGSLLQQQADLSDFDAQEFTTILHSILRFELAAIEAEGGSKWSLY
jgi:hypothetical protein